MGLRPVDTSNLCAANHTRFFSPGTACSRSTGGTVLQAGWLFVVALKTPYWNGGLTMLSASTFSTTQSRWATMTSGHLGALRYPKVVVPTRNACPDGGTAGTPVEFELRLVAAVPKHAWHAWIPCTAKPATGIPRWLNYELRCRSPSHSVLGNTHLRKCNSLKTNRKFHLEHWGSFSSTSISANSLPEFRTLIALQNRSLPPVF